MYLPADPKKSPLVNAELFEEVISIFGVLNYHGTDPERVEFIMEEKVDIPVNEKNICMTEDLA